MPNYLCLKCRTMAGLSEQVVECELNGWTRHGGPSHTNGYYRQTMTKPNDDPVEVAWNARCERELAKEASLKYGQAKEQIRTV